MTTKKRHLFHGLFAINFLISLGFGMSDAFFPIYYQYIGARGLLLGLAFGGYALSKIVFSPLMGKLADRVGRPPLIYCGLFLYIFISISYLMVENLVFVICLRLLQGLGCTMFRPVIQAMIADHTPIDKRGSVMGSFDISFYAALSIGPIIGGIVMDLWGFNGLFSTLLLCSVTALGIATAVLPRRFTGIQKSGFSDRFHLGSLYRNDFTYLGLLLYILGRACGIAACAIFLPIFLFSELGLRGIQVGIIMASTTLVMTVLLRPAGKIADMVSRKMLVICGGIVVSLLYMSFPMASSFIQALCITLLIGAFSALSQPAASALLTEEGQRLGMGASIGIFHAFLNFGFVLGPFIGSAIQTWFGTQEVFIGIGLIGLSSLSGLIVSAKLHFPLFERARINFIPKL